MNITESKNGGVYIIDGEKRYQLSAMQVKILALTFHSIVKHTPRSTKARRARIDRINERRVANGNTPRPYPPPEPRGRPAIVRRIDRRGLHKGVFGHDKPCRGVGPALSASNRAALSRSLRRLNGIDLLVGDTITKQGEKIVRRLLKLEIVKAG